MSLILSDCLNKYEVINIKNTDWENAINVRRSTRSFEMREVDEGTMSNLKNFVSDIKVPFKHDVKVRFFKAQPDKIMYNHRLNPPPDHAAFITSTDIQSISAAGFVGEMVILYATSLGLATCWYGHYSMVELQNVMPHIKSNDALPKYGYGNGVVQGERAICITPFGYWKTDGVRVFDRMTVITSEPQTQASWGIFRGGYK